METDKTVYRTGPTHSVHFGGNVALNRECSNVHVVISWKCWSTNVGRKLLDTLEVSPDAVLLTLFVTSEMLESAKEKYVDPKSWGFFSLHSIVRTFWPPYVKDAWEEQTHFAGDTYLVFPSPYSDLQALLTYFPAITVTDGNRIKEKKRLNTERNCKLASDTKA